MLNPKHLGSACAPSLGAVMDCGASCFRHSILIRPIQPRNSTVQCIFLAYFTPQMLPFPMARLIPNKTSCRSVTPHRALLATHLFSALFSRTYKSLSLAYPSISIFIFSIFMQLQIPLQANPLFSHLCKTPGVSPKEFDSIARVRSVSLPQIHFFHTVAASWLSFSPSCPLFSSTCSLLCQKQGGGVG